MAVVASVVVVVASVVVVVVTFQSPFSSSSSFSSLSWTSLETISSFGSVEESSPPTVSFPSNDPVDDGDTSTDCTNGMILPNDHTDIIDSSSSSIILIRSSSCGCVDGRILRGVLDGDMNNGCFGHHRRIIVLRLAIDSRTHTAGSRLTYTTYVTLVLRSAIQSSFKYCIY